MWKELHWPAALVSCTHKQIVAIQFGYHAHRAVWYTDPATTRQNTAQQHGIYFNKQEGIIREEGEMVLPSRRWWLRTFYTSFEVPYDRSGKCERAGSLSKCKVQRLLHHLSANTDIWNFVSQYGYRTLGSFCVFERMYMHGSTNLKWCFLKTVFLLFEFYLCSFEYCHTRTKNLCHFLKSLNKQY